MEELELIESRYSIAIPSIYRVLQTAGHFDSTQPDKYIEFTDHEWMPLKNIANHEFCDWQINTREFFVPFAHSARRDEWGWRKDWNTGSEFAVVFCERGPEGRGFAPNFCGFLYRMLLEELSGTWLLESDEDEVGKMKIRRSIETICPLLPSKWCQTIQELSRLPWHTNNSKSICVFPRSECNRIINTDLGFAHLDEEFLQEPDDSN